jgi:hypothetical protein
MAGNRYIIFLSYIPDEAMEDGLFEDSRYRYLATGSPLGLFLLKDGNVYKYKDISLESEESFIKKISDEKWLNEVERPEWAREVLYLPEGAEIDMTMSYCYEKYYQLAYRFPETPERKSFRIEILQWQADEKTEPPEEYAWVTNNEKAGKIIYIEGIPVRYFGMRNKDMAKCLYFVLSGLVVQIESNRFNDDAEMIKIVRSIILQSKDVS